VTIRFFYLILFLSLALQQVSEGTTPDTAAALLHYDRIGEVVVTATRIERQLRYTASNIDVVTNESWQGTRTHYHDDAFILVPGVHVQSRHNQDEARISIRGSGIRTNWGVRGVNVLLNGIPLTDADGLTDIDAVDLGIVDRVEVLRGPASSLYGTGSLGGVINFVFGTRPEPFGLHASALAGSFGFQRYGVHLHGDRRSYSYMLSASHHQKEGERDMSSGNSQRVFGLFLMQPDERSEFNLMAFWRSIDFELPGSLTREEFDADPLRASQGAVDGQWHKKKTRSRLGLSYRRMLSGDIDLGISGYYGEHATPYHPIFMVLEEDFRTAGGEVQATVRPRIVAGMPGTLITGLSLQHITGGARYYVNRNGERGALGRNEQVAVTKSGFHIRYETVPVTSLIVTAGGRMDLLTYRFTDLIGDGSFSEHYARFSPSAGLSYEPLPLITLHLEATMGFEPPAITELRGADALLEPIEAIHIEGGLRFMPDDRITATVTGYRMDLRNDIIPYTEGFQTKYRNAERSRHTGLEIGLHLQPVRTVRMDIAYTLSYFRFVGDEEHDGNAIPGIPPHRLGGQLVFELPAGFTVGGRMEWNDAMYLDDANGDRQAAYVLASLFGRWQHRMIAVRFSVENVFDRKYASYVRINESNRRYFEPGDGRGFFVGIELSY
jgi:iron complex outermembrane recepter protein